MLLGLELFPLNSDIGAHSFLRILSCELVHGMVEAVKPSQGDELELVPHTCQLLLETANTLSIQVFFPVEAGRTIVRQRFVRVCAVNSVREPSRLLEIRRRGLTPYNVSIRSIT